MSAPRIERGPMTAEVLERDYTRIGNRLLRDPEISFKAKGVFGFMASHKDGFGVSPESIAAAGADGISAVKSALRELEQHGYLVRSQPRAKGGVMGRMTYRITDMPSSEPVDGNRLADESPAVDAPAADRPHKKTIPLKEDQLVEDEVSLPAVPAQRPEPEPEHERETSTSPKPSTAQQVLRAAGLVESSEEQEFITWAADHYRIRSSALWRTVAANGDLTDWVDTWRSLGGSGGSRPLPGTDTHVSGWMDLANQLREPERGRQHTPYNNNVWDHLAQQAAAGERPDGWERYPHCGHPDCDETTRVRDGSYCSGCHPQMQFL